MHGQPLNRLKEHCQSQAYMDKRVGVSRYSSFSIQLLHSQVDLLLRVDLNPTGRNNIDGGCNVTDEGAILGRLG